MQSGIEGKLCNGMQCVVIHSSTHLIHRRLQIKIPCRGRYLKEGNTLGGNVHPASGRTTIFGRTLLSSTSEVSLSDLTSANCESWELMIFFKPLQHIVDVLPARDMRLIYMQRDCRPVYSVIESSRRTKANGHDSGLSSVGD